MKAELLNAVYKNPMKTYGYHGEAVYMSTGKTEVNIQFRCYDEKTDSYFTLELDGTGLPYLGGNGQNQYEIEIKIKEIPKLCPKEYIIK